jgi:DNA modification methylase
LGVEVSMQERRRTSTSNFGVSRRENHDASGFYGRFHAPELNRDLTVLPATPVDDPFQVGDARDMAAVASGSVALVVTSPPYFAGKQYEEELERDGVPSSYFEYLDMLRAVFAECARTLEPGGRIAVNVANLGRKPYRSLSADVIGILQDDLGLLLRGELVWQKGEGASGSCAWGSFRSAANPVLRDITERVIIASKGRFDRARPAKQRALEGLPHKSTLLTEDFMALTLDVWSIPPESAKRVGHPAPFPVELPEQLIRLYTYENDLVLDPFMGSGSSLVAAARLDRRYIGYDLDPAYADIARQRVADAIATVASRVAEPPPVADAPPVPEPPAAPIRRSRRKTAAEPKVASVAVVAVEDFQTRATREGKAAQRLAEDLLREANFAVTRTNARIAKAGVVVNFEARDDDGGYWYFDVSGAFTTHRGGLLRTDTVWKSLGRAHAMRSHLERTGARLVFLTSNLPKRPSEGDTALRAAGPGAFFDAIEMLARPDLERLTRYARGGLGTVPEPGFWTVADLARYESDRSGS